MSKTYRFHVRSSFTLLANAGGTPMVSTVVDAVIRSARHAVAGMCLAWLLAPSDAQADQARLDDLGGQIEYAFYAQERTPLQQAVQQLEALATEEGSAEARLWLNYGRWKQGQLAGKADSDAAATAASHCTAENWSDKEPVVVQAIGHALNAACAEVLAELQPVRGLLHRRDRQRELQQALALAPRQAQVQFIAAWIAQHDGDAKSADQALQRAALLYDAADNPANSSGHVGDWGQAEMFYLLGKSHLRQHNALTARNALERALVLAPDYRDAATLIKTLSVR